LSSKVDVDGSLFYYFILFIYLFIFLNLQNTFVGMYATLNELWKQAACRYKPFSKSWNYHITHHTTGLVGFLSTSISNGYWTLSDATQSISCVLTGDMRDLVSLHGAVVLLMKYTVVAEICQVRHMWCLVPHTV
jgi:hypothetical protein